MQITPAVPEQHRYNINSNWWRLLTEDGRAGLVLHEVVYFVESNGRIANDFDMTPIRYFNSTLARPETTAMSVNDYLNMLESLQFSDPKEIDVDGLKCAGVPTFYASAKVKQCHLLQPQILSVNEQDLTFTGDILFYENSIVEGGNLKGPFVWQQQNMLCPIAAADAHIWLRPDGTLSHIYTAKDFDACFSDRADGVVKGGMHDVSFYESGVIMEACGITDAVSLPVFGQSARFFTSDALGARTTVRFHENGMIKFGTILDVPVTLVAADGTNYVVTRSEALEFDEVGKVIRSF